MNPEPVTCKRKTPAKPETRALHTPMTPLVNDAECTEEAICRRASYVGPVLEHIKTDIEKHCEENLDLEEP